MAVPEEMKGAYLLGKPMSGWEKATWVLMAFYILIVLVAFWYLGWSQLGFPL